MRQSRYQHLILGTSCVFYIEQLNNTQINSSIFDNVNYLKNSTSLQSFMSSNFKIPYRQAVTVQKNCNNENSCTVLDRCMLFLY